MTETVVQFVPPYGPDVGADPILSLLLPLSVALAGAMIVARWRDLFLVAAVALAAFVAAFSIQLPSLAVSSLTNATGAQAMGTVFAAYYAIFFGAAALAFAIRRAVTRFRAASAG